MLGLCDKSVLGVSFGFLFVPLFHFTLAEFLVSIQHKIGVVVQGVVGLFFLADKAVNLVSKGFGSVIDPFGDQFFNRIPLLLFLDKLFDGLNVRLDLLLAFIEFPFKNNQFVVSKRVRPL